MGSDCDAGCKAIVRIQFDQLQADGTLETLKRPLYVFAGVQFEKFQPVVKPSDGDVIVVGDCAKSMLDHFPNARFWGDCEEYPGYTPIWANRPGRRNCQLRSRTRSTAAVSRESHSFEQGRSGDAAELFAQKNTDVASGTPETAGDQGLRHSHPDAGAVPGCRGQGITRRRSFLRHHSPGRALLWWLYPFRCRRSHSPRPGFVYLEQGACRRCARFHLCGTGIFR